MNRRRFRSSFVDAKESPARRIKPNGPMAGKELAPPEVTREASSHGVKQVQSRKQWLALYALAVSGLFAPSFVAGQCSGNFCVLNGVRIVAWMELTLPPFRPLAATCRAAKYMSPKE